MYLSLLIVSTCIAVPVAVAAPTFPSTTITTETVTSSLTTASLPIATLAQQYTILLSSVLTAANEVNTVMLNFRNERIRGNDVDQIWIILGVPSIHSFPLLLRETAVAQDILATYRENMNVFDTALQYVVSDEDSYRGHFAYRTRFESLRRKVRDIVIQLDNIIRSSTLPDGTNLAPIDAQVWFPPSADETERTKRDYVALRQLSEYLPAVHAGISRIRP
ncbi:uncharacterized protein LOC117105753 [Anneissia japonica]|uniref:uncharacterized protein LOC117105753 n=1 Tax=Anneissia japonica TaxID=1529436 RepID=UPI0014255521|nr:uncharacterized protein LOC117105753 [Anneissia japonica]